MLGISALMGDILLPRLNTNLFPIANQVLRRKGEKNFEKGVKRRETVEKEGKEAGHNW